MPKKRPELTCFSKYLYSDPSFNSSASGNKNMFNAYFSSKYSSGILIISKIVFAIS